MKKGKRAVKKENKENIEVKEVVEVAKTKERKAVAEKTANIPAEIKLCRLDYTYEASIIVMNRNRIKLLETCLNSILKHTQDVKYELIIVDNLSTDGSREYLLKHWADKAVVLFEKDPTSYAASNNRIMQWSYGKYIYLLNNDCEALPGWLRNAIDFAENRPEVGHVASLVLWPNGTVMSHGANLDEHGTSEIPFFKKLANTPDLTQEANYAYAGFGLYRRDVCEKIGFLPEYKVPIYWDDTSYSLDVWRSGYDVRYCPDSKIIHALYHDENRRHHVALQAANKGLQYFMKDWGEFLKENKGFRPDFPFTGKRPYKYPGTSFPERETQTIQEYKDALEKLKHFTGENTLKEIIPPVKKKVILLVSNVEFTDGGGSKRPANLARSFVDMGYKVVFINLYPNYETTKFTLTDTDGVYGTEGGRLKNNIVFKFIDTFDIKEFIYKYGDRCERAIFELPHQKILPVLKALKETSPNTKLILEYIDNWETTLGRSWYNEQVELEILEYVQQINVTAKPLEEIVQQKLSKLNNIQRVQRGKYTFSPEIRYISNGVNTELFKPHAEFKRPSDLPEGSYIFYMGALWGNWIDFDLLDSLMTTYPEKKFVFCGAGLSECLRKKWDAYKNCYLLGLKPVSQMPCYIHHAEKCIIPFKFSDDTDIVKYVSPLKLFEYYAMQKPIVVTDYDEIRNIPGLYLANNKEAFIELVGNQLSLTDPDVWKKEIQQMSWNAKAWHVIAPLVSIVLPTYNQPQYLKEACLSVINQSYPYKEFIIVNDGSTDNTKELLKEFHSPEFLPNIPENTSVTIINCSHNSKLPGALNSGFQRAQGDLYTWTSDDNIMLPQQLEILVDYLENHPGVGMVYSNYQLIDEEGNPLYGGAVREKDRDPLKRSFVALPLQGTKEALLKGDNFIGASFLYRASVARDIGEYDISLFGAEDYDYWLRMANKYIIAHYPGILYKYRIHGNSLNSRAKELKIYDNVRKCLKKNSVIEFENVAVTKAVGVVSPSLLPSKVEISSPVNIFIQAQKLKQGGLEKVIHSLATNLNKKKINPVVLSESLGGEYAEKLTEAGIPVVYLQGDPVKLKHAITQYSPKLVNLHYSIFGIEEYVSQKIPVVYTIHNNYLWVGGEEKRKRREAYQFIPAFIAVSENVREYFQRHFGIDAVKIHVIPNGHLPLPICHKEITRQNLGIAEKDFVFINVATFTPIKQQNLILEALHKIGTPTIKCLFVGNIHDRSYFDALRATLLKYNLNEKVKIIHSKYEDMRSYYGLSNAFILPSLTEGWSMAVMEAVECGLPLLLSNVGSAPKMIRGNGVMFQRQAPLLNICANNLNEHLILCERDKGELANKIEEVYNNYIKYKEGALKIQSGILNKYTMANMVAKYESLFLKNML